LEDPPQALLVAQRNHWVYAGGSASREEGGGCGDRDHEQSYARENKRIGRADAVEETGQEAGENQRAYQANSDAD
jgi:hypothetical protein